MKKYVVVFACLCLALLLLACDGGQDEAGTLPVMLVLPDGITLSGGQNPQMVTAGEDAVFPVMLETGYSVRENEAYTYADGQITVHNVRYPVTVTVSLNFDASLLQQSGEAAGGSFSFSLGADDIDRGRADASHSPGTYPAGTEIVLTATPTAGGRFVCWSLGMSVAEGGMPLACTPEYTLQLSADMRVIANFGSDTTATLLYDANGGKTADGRSYLRHDTQVDYYIYPHTLPSQGQMIREGFLLYAYNTAADGSGTEYTFGANVPTPESGTLLLYAQWIKADPTCFTYETNNDKVQIIGCTADTETVVVPETIEGKPVVSLRAGALSGLSAMKTLILPPSLKTIAAGAVADCPNFTTLYLCDSILMISDDFYRGCPEFQTLKLGAVRDPVHMKTLTATTGIKFQRLLQIKAQKKLIVIGGSSAAYGIRSPMLEEALGGEYALLNYGNNWTTSSLFFLDIITDFIGEGDLVLLAPEPCAAQLGSNAMNVTTWQLIEAALDSVQYVDLRKYTGFFSTLSSFNAARNNLSPGSYEEHHTFVVDHWGDYSTELAGQNENYVKTPNSFDLSPSLISDTGTARLNERIADIRARGGEVYQTFSPVNVNSLTANAKQRIYQLAYEQAVESKLDSIPISSVSDTIYSGRLFYNNDLHLCTEGARIRTQTLADQLKAALGK
ncbi:MAG: hypothetical protein IJC15_00425 [Clostridia bacterium]|nr:hypothetical protein [Clostridia bacterium]